MIFTGVGFLVFRSTGGGGLMPKCATGGGVFQEDFFGNVKKYKQVLVTACENQVDIRDQRVPNSKCANSYVIRII